MGTGLSRPDGSPIDFADNPSDTDIQEATARMMDEWRAATAEADAADKEKKRDRDAKWDEWTEWLDSPEYAREQAEKQTQLKDAFQRLRRRFLREPGARFGLRTGGTTRLLPSSRRPARPSRRPKSPATAHPLP